MSDEVESNTIETRTWNNPESARQYLKRHPAEGHSVIFDNSQAAYVIRPDAQVEQEGTDPPPVEELFPPKAANGKGGRRPAARKAAPAKSPRKAPLAKPTRKGGRKEAPAPKAAKKAAKQPAAEKAKRSRADGPVGKTAELIKLALRKSGASAAELFELTQWHKCPWKWSFHNPKGNGWAQKYGYGFRVERIDGEVRYFLSRSA